MPLITSSKENDNIPKELLGSKYTVQEDSVHLNILFLGNKTVT